MMSQQQKQEKISESAPATRKALGLPPAIHSGKCALCGNSIPQEHPEATKDKPICIDCYLCIYTIKVEADRRKEEEIVVMTRCEYLWLAWRIQAVPGLAFFGLFLSLLGAGGCALAFFGVRILGLGQSVSMIGSGLFACTIASWAAPNEKDTARFAAVRAYLRERRKQP